MPDPVIVKVGADTSDFNTSIGGALQSMKSALMGIHPAVAATVAIVATVGAAAFKVGEDFDKAYDKIRAGTGATGVTLDGLKDSFKGALASVPSDMETVAGAMAALNTQTKATGVELEGLTVQVVDVSRLLGEDATSNANAYGQAIKQWGLPMEEAEDNLDHLVALSQNYAPTLATLIGHTTTYGSVLNNAGLSMAEAADLFARLDGLGGGMVSRVMPGLNAAFRKFAAAGLEPKEALQAIIDAMLAAETKSEALNIAMTVFGAEGAQRLTTSILAGEFALEGLGSGMDDAKGAVERLAKANDDWTEALGETWNAIKVALEPAVTRFYSFLSASIENVLKPTVGAIASFFTTARDAGNALREFVGLAPVTDDFTESMRKLSEQMKGNKEEAEGLSDEKKGLPAVAGAIDEAGDKAKEKKLSFDELMAALKGNKEEAKDTAEAVSDLQDKVDRFDLDGFNRELAEAERAAAKAVAEIKKLNPAISDLGIPLPGVSADLSAFSADLEAMASVVNESVVPSMTRAELDALELENAYRSLGIETKQLKDKELADLAAELRKVEQAFADGKVPVEDLKAAQEAYAKAAGKEPGGATDATKGFREALGDLLSPLGSVSDSLIRFSADDGFVFGAAAALDSLKTKAANLVNEGINLLFDSLQGLIGLGPGVTGFTGILDKLFGAGGGGGGIPGVPSGGGGGSPGGGGGGGAGAAAGGGIGGAVNIVTGIGSMISGVIGNFQNAKMETTLNAIEESTRRSMIHLGEGGSSILDWLQDIMAQLHIEHESFVTIPQIRDRVTEMSSLQAQRLPEIVESVESLPGRIADRVADALASRLEGLRVEMDGTQVGELVGDFLARRASFA